MGLRKSIDFPDHLVTVDTDFVQQNMETDIVAHFFTLEQLSLVLSTDLEMGMTKENVIKQMAIYGPNVLEKAKDRPMWKIFKDNMFGWFPVMLWIGGLMSITIHFAQYWVHLHSESNENLYLGIIILMVVIFTGLFGFYQEAKNVKVMKGFADMMPSYARVIREGRHKLIPSAELVFGDLIEMNAGEIVPADVRLIEVNNFRIDMSAITGETQAQSRTIYYTNDNPFETKNLAFSSCLISEGNAKGIIVATGKFTVIGKIAGLVTHVKKDEAPVALEIKHFIKIVSFIAFIMGGIFFFMVSYMQNSWIAGFYYMVGIIVANVPEGLLVTMIIAFTLTAQKLTKKNCMAKKLQSVETLGAISVICTDKTGTLTENRMSVSHLCFDDQIFDKNDELLKSNSVYKSIAFAASLCLRAEFDPDASVDVKKRKIIGDATEIGILRYMEETHSATEVRKNNPKLCEIPFTSKTKYQLSIHKSLKSNNRHLVMKGAPEIIIFLCKTILLSSGETEITIDIEQSLQKSIINLGNMGERVIAYCDAELLIDDYPAGYAYNIENPNFPMSGFRFLGMISLIDPPRETVPYSIEKCRSAGIKVIMVTGDHPITALAISKKVGIISKDSTNGYDSAFKIGADPKMYMKTIDIFHFDAAVVTGEELKGFSAGQLDRLLSEMREITFARTTPQQKLLIVESCQRIGHVVAVTGDGVNDAPALKKANIGIAMGVTGTDVSKEAADMLLLDDNFSSIILGIEEGRLIYDNLKKSIAFILTSNIPEMLPFILHAVIGIPLPLHALLIIAINVLTDLWPAISFAYENAEADIMKRQPRTLDERLVTRKLIMMAYFQVGLLQAFAAMNGYFVMLYMYGFTFKELLFSRDMWYNERVDDYQDSHGQEWTFVERQRLEILAQTSYYVCMVVVQIFDCLICKTRRLSLFQQGMKNHMLNLGILTEIVVSLLIVYVPIFNQFVYTAPVPWIIWMTAIPYAILLLILDELRKYMIRKYPGGWFERETYF